MKSYTITVNGTAYDEDYDLEQLMPWTEAVVDTCKASACE